MFACVFCIATIMKRYSIEFATYHNFNITL